MVISVLDPDRQTGRRGAGQASQAYTEVVDAGVTCQSAPATTTTTGWTREGWDLSPSEMRSEARVL